MKRMIWILTLVLLAAACSSDTSEVKAKLCRLELWGLRLA